MRRPRSLRARFALWTALLFLVGLSALAAYVYGSMQRGITAAQDHALSLAAAQVAAGLEIVGTRPIFTEDFASEPENVDLAQRGFTVRVLGATGAEIAGFGPHRARLAH
jgi:hypothetical protein